MNKCTEERPYSFEIQPFNDGLLNYWTHYGIHEDTLRRFRVRSLKRYESVSAEGKKFELYSSPTEPMFAYIGNGYVKIYRPHSPKIRFLYGGRMPTTYCFGMEQIPAKGDMLFITGGEKDVLSLYAHGFNAICFNSETAQIPTSIIESLQLRFRHIILLYDADETGVREAHKQSEHLAEYKVLNLSLPLSGTKSEKDISDFFALGNGAKELKELLAKMFSDLYSQTMMMLRSCEIDYENPPDISKSVVAVNGVPLGTQDNLFCITGGEGTGKSNYVGAILAGTLGEKRLPIVINGKTYYARLGADKTALVVQRTSNGSKSYVQTSPILFTTWNWQKYTNDVRGTEKMFVYLPKGRYRATVSASRNESNEFSVATSKDIEVNVSTVASFPNQKAIFNVDGWRKEILTSDSKLTIKIERIGE